MSFLDFVAKPGMKVVVKMSKEARGWRPNSPPDGATGVLIERYRYKDYVERFGFKRRSHEPGIYETSGVWFAKMDNPEYGEPEYGGAETGIARASNYHFEIHPDSKAEYDRLAEELWYGPVINNKTADYSAQKAMLDNMIRIGDLPDTKAWQGDQIIPVDGLWDEDRDLKFIVSSIDYRDDAVSYSVQAYNQEGRSWFGTNFRDEHIKDIIRGNLWKMEHGEPLVFRDIQEEAAFAYGLGKVEEVRNPATGVYSWTLEEFLQAVQDDIVDCMKLGSIPFSNTTKINAQRFDDRDLGERLRQATLEGFDVAKPLAMA